MKTSEKEKAFRDKVEQLLTNNAETEAWKEGWLWTIVRESYDCGRDLGELVDRLQEVETLCKDAKLYLMLHQNAFKDVRSDKPFERHFGRGVRVTRKEIL